MDYKFFLLFNFFLLISKSKSNQECVEDFECYFNEKCLSYQNTKICKDVTYYISNNIPVIPINDELPSDFSNYTNYNTNYFVTKFYPQDAVGEGLTCNDGTYQDNNSKMPGESCLPGCYGTTCKNEICDNVLNSNDLICMPGLICKNDICINKFNTTPNKYLLNHCIEDAQCNEDELCEKNNKYQICDLIKRSSCNNNEDCKEGFTCTLTSNNAYKCRKDNDNFIQNINKQNLIYFIGGSKQLYWPQDCLTENYDCSLKTIKLFNIAYRKTSVCCPGFYCDKNFICKRNPLTEQNFENLNKCKEDIQCDLNEKCSSENLICIDNSTYMSNEVPDSQQYKKYYYPQNGVGEGETCNIQSNKYDNLKMPGESCSTGLECYTTCYYNEDDNEGYCQNSIINTDLICLPGLNCENNICINKFNTIPNKYLLNHCIEDAQCNADETCTLNNKNPMCISNTKRSCKRNEDCKKGFRCKLNKDGVFRCLDQEKRKFKCSEHYEYFDSYDYYENYYQYLSKKNIDWGLMCRNNLDCCEGFECVILDNNNKKLCIPSKNNFIDWEKIFYPCTIDSKSLKCDKRKILFVDTKKIEYNKILIPENYNVKCSYDICNSLSNKCCKGFICKNNLCVKQNVQQLDCSKTGIICENNEDCDLFNKECDQICINTVDINKKYGSSNNFRKYTKRCMNQNSIEVEIPLEHYCVEGVNCANGGSCDWNAKRPRCLIGDSCTFDSNCKLNHKCSEINGVNKCQLVYRQRYDFCDEKLFKCNPDTDICSKNRCRPIDNKNCKYKGEECTSWSSRNDNIYDSDDCCEGFNCLSLLHKLFKHTCSAN